MKKIFVLSNMYPSSEHPTYGIFVKNQVKLLESAGVQVDVSTIQNPGKGKITTVKKYMSWFFHSFIYMVKNKKHLALTHAHYAFPTGFISLIGKKMLGIPYVVTVHGGDIDKMAAKSPLIEKLTKKILNEAGSVIVVGEKLQEDVTAKFEVPAKQVEVISMGVDTSIFKRSPKQESMRNIGLDDKGNIVLFVGNVIREKGLLELVEAFHSLKETKDDATLYIMGSQKNQQFVDELKARIDELKMEDIHFIEPQAQQSLVHWMNSADVLVLPSYHEGFGLVALEAMAVGTKVVGTDVGGLSYLLANQAGILVEPKNVGSLVTGLQEALNPESEAVNQAVCEEVVASHSFVTIERKLLRIYESVGKR
ncbi:glycosyltransferase [Sporosarcina sp. CAU 1771]